MAAKHQLRGVAGRFGYPGAERQFVHVGLRHDDGAGGEQLFGDRCRPVGTVIEQGRRGGGGRKPGDVDIVLDHQRQSMEAAPNVALASFVVRIPCRRQKPFGVEHDEGVQGREFGGAPAERFGDLQRGHPAALQA